MLQFRDLKIDEKKSQKKSQTIFITIPHFLPFQDNKIQQIFSH